VENIKHLLLCAFFLQIAGSLYRVFFYAETLILPNCNFELFYMIGNKNVFENATKNKIIFSS